MHASAVYLWHMPIHLQIIDKDNMQSRLISSANTCKITREPR